MARTLTMAEVRELQALPGARGTASRFMIDGVSFDILNGERTSKGANVIHQRVYWDLSREQAQRAAKLTGTRLVFDGPNGAEQVELNRVRETQIREHVETVRESGVDCHCALHR